jgi:hypothetical protein
VASLVTDLGLGLSEYVAKIEKARRSALPGVAALNPSKGKGMPTG